MSQGWVVETCVVSVQPCLPNCVAGASIGLLRVINWFPKDVHCLYAGTVYEICLSTVTSQGAGALSQCPGGTITGKRFMFILILVLWFGQRRRRGGWRWGWRIVRWWLCDWTWGLGVSVVYKAKMA